MPTKTKTRLVRYVSPFGSPASMLPEAAEAYLAQDSELWELMESGGLLDERMLRIGRPRIGDNEFRLSELPEWVVPPGEVWDTIRMLVGRAHDWSRVRGGEYVVVERAGRYATVKRAFVIAGDAVVWETR